MIIFKNTRSTVFTCAVILASVHIIYLWRQIGQLPHNTARYSLSGFGNRLHKGTVPVSQSASGSLHDAPALILLCRDLQPPKGECQNALHQGLCYGDLLSFCMKSCGQCRALESLITQATGIQVKQADKLECKDASDNCREFVEREKCDAQPLQAISTCKASCEFCQPDAGLSPSDTCADRLDVCSYLATSRGLCGSVQDGVWMQTVCKASCGGCTQGGISRSKIHELSSLRRAAGENQCTDFHADCSKWAAADLCNSNRGFMSAHCRLSCRLCGATQNAADGAAKADWKVGLDNAGHWSLSASQSSMGQSGTGAAYTRDCRDENDLCSKWAMSGECTRNSGYMLLTCKLSCGVCQRMETGFATSADIESGWAVSPVLSNALPTTPFSYYPEALMQVQLNNGVLMPTIGFGTAGLGEGTEAAVSSALLAGYRHIDSAQAREWYREDLVGKAVHGRMSVPREELFLTTKIHPRHLGYEETLAAFSQSLVDLGTEYVDLLLLHYPNCWGDLCKPLPGSPPTPTPSAAPHTFKETWAAFEELYRANKTRAIGVSNFDNQQLTLLYSIAKIKPQVLQVHMDPFAQNRDLQAMCKANGIQMVAYSSLGTQWHTTTNPVLTNSGLKSIATAVNRTVAQVVLRWVLHMGVLVLPRSSNPAHMKESLEILDFSLNEAQIAHIMMLEGLIR